MEQIASFEGHNKTSHINLKFCNVTSHFLIIMENAIAFSVV